LVDIEISDIENCSNLISEEKKYITS